MKYCWIYFEKEKEQTNTKTALVKWILRFLYTLNRKCVYYIWRLTRRIQRKSEKLSQAESEKSRRYFVVLLSLSSSGRYSNTWNSIYSSNIISWSSFIPPSVDFYLNWSKHSCDCDCDCGCLLRVQLCTTIISHLSHYFFFVSFSIWESGVFCLCQDCYIVAVDGDIFRLILRIQLTGCIYLTDNNNNKRCMMRCYQKRKWNQIQ